MITLDFETRSRASLKAVGLHAYARDTSTEVLCVAWKFDDGPVYSSYDTDPKELFGRVSTGERIHAHNAEFEYEIWNNVFSPDLPLKLSQMRCSMARAMAASLPASLGELAAILRVPVQKDAEGAKIMRLMCQPDKKGNFIHTPEYFSKLVSYCKQDVEAEYQCELKLPHLSATEQRLWEITARINSEGLKVDRDACEAAVALLTEHSDRLETEIDMLTGGNVRTGKQVQKMLDQFKTWGFTINDMTKDSIAEALKSPDLTPEVKRLLELRAEGSRSSVAKYQKFLTMMGVDGRVRGLLRYHGASTGRWSGSGVQPQNFPRGTIKNVNLIIDAMKLRDYKLLDSLYPSVSEAASAALRGMIVADNEFFDGDFSAIEARVLVWCAGARTQLADYHAGVDTYKKMASKIYRIPADRVNDFPQRQLGKAAVLGCFGANTLVLTNSGWKHIINLTLEDKLWDGVQWVSHEGVICQGEREITECCGILATPEHRIQTRAKWVQFQELQENTTYLQSALEMGACGLKRILEELGVECLPLWFRALATVAKYIGWTHIISGVMRLQDAIPAQKLQQIIPENTIGDTLNSARTQRIGKGYSIAFRLAFLGAKTPKTSSIKTMGVEASACNPIGSRIEGDSYPILCNSMVGIIPHWNWTGLTSIAITVKGICASYLNEKTLKIKGQLERCRLKFYACKKNSKKLQPVYDVLNSGPNNCFTILSNRGPLIAHNCGYGMGAEKFIDAAKSYGIVVDEALAKHAITTFREENSEVTKLWYDVETAAKNAVKYPGQVYSAGKCKFKSANGHLRIQLPSSRVLYFPFAKLALKETKFGIREELRFTGLFQGKPVPESTYGGKLVENIVQGIARDLMAFAMINLDNVGLKPVLTVHDEILVDSPDSSRFAEFQEIMERVPEWGEGIPLKVGAWRGKRFRK